MRPAPLVTLALPLLLAACRGVGEASEAPVPAGEAPPAAAAQEPTRVDVIPLSYAVAGPTSQVLGRALGRREGSTLMVVAEPRTNALIVSGSAAELLAVRELVKRIDVEVAEPR